MFKNDYILDMIEQMADVLKKVLALTDTRRFGEGHDEIDKMMRRLGYSRSLVRMLPAREIINLAGSGQFSKEDRLFMLARLLETDAGIYSAENKKAEAHDCCETALALLTAIAKDNDSEKLDEINKEIEAVRYLITENIKDNSMC